MTMLALGQGGLTRLVLCGLPQGTDLKAVFVTMYSCTRSADIVNVYSSILK